MIPRLLIAGTSSGVGKTTVMVGLIRALRIRGLRVAVFKCGPDYLDPSYHARAAGVPSHNLDGWMMGREAVIETFLRGSSGADIALIEGVMGLFDGASPASDEGSTAEIAKWLRAPVVLVCDAGGMARSLAPLVKGFTIFDPALSVVGLITNRVGGRTHVELLKKAVESPRIIGALIKDGAPAFPERHLGLRYATPDVLPDEVLNAWGDHVREWCDLDAIIELAETAPSLTDIRQHPILHSHNVRCRIGLAFDEAFHFYYEDNLRRLESFGAELVRFSPVHDTRLPDVDGLYFGGGYPEIHASALSANQAMLRAIAKFAEQERPIYGECGGLMYLSRGIRTLDGMLHPMVGLIPGEVEMRGRLQALGYVEVNTREVTMFGPAGLRFRGHQFRYSDLRLHGDVDRIYTVQRQRGGESFLEGYRVGNTVASYVHAHWGSNPHMAEGFVLACVLSMQKRR